MCSSPLLSLTCIFQLIKKLQTAESTIENLHQHLEELGRSDTLSRARHEHEVVVSGLQKKYETEIKVLKEKMDKMNESLKEKVSIVVHCLLNTPQTKDH